MKKKKKKSAKLKSFFFQDYPETDIIFNDKRKNFIKISLNRVTFLFIVFLSLIAIFSIKIIYLSLLPEKELFFDNFKKNYITERADIVDRNGIILARNIEIYSAGINPKLVTDKKKLFINLKIIFPDIVFDNIENVSNSILIDTISFKIGYSKELSGLNHGIKLLQIGDNAKIIIPSYLGFGMSGYGKAVPPYSTLLLNVKLLNIE